MAKSVSGERQERRAEAQRHGRMCVVREPFSPLLVMVDELGLLRPPSWVQGNHSDLSVFVRMEDRPPVPRGGACCGATGSPIDTEESALRGLGGQHYLCPQVKGRGVVESEADAGVIWRLPSLRAP